MKHLKSIIAVALLSAVAFNANAFRDDVSGETDVFSIFDLNKDGRISMAEVTMGMMEMLKMDKDGDHFLSKSELQDQDDYSHWMAQFDLNRDGRISLSEMPRSLHGKMEKMDKNRDHYLTIDELTGERDIWKN